MPRPPRARSYLRDWQWIMGERWVCRHCGIRDQWDLAVPTPDGVRVSQATFAVTFAYRRELAAHYRTRHADVSMPPELESPPSVGA